MKKTCISKDESLRDIRIELYCRSVENLLEKIKDKCGDKAKRETFIEELPELTDTAEELF